MTATAVRFHGRGDIRVEHLDEPRCGKGEVKVSLPSFLVIFIFNIRISLTEIYQMKPAFVGICGSGKTIHHHYSISRLDINIRQISTSTRPAPS